MKRCDICPNNCIVGENTVCGRSSSLDENVVETTALAIDPVEKKPLYHYRPGSETLSVGTLGCNLKCLNCQNHSIAQPENPSLVAIRRITPESIVNLAVDNDLNSISWTYNEASIHPEWIINTAKTAQQYDIETVLVTNGYTSQSTLESLVDYVDAVNVDLKSLSEDFYLKVCSGRLEPVLNSIEYYYDNGVHTEITTLLIPGYNDGVESIQDVCDFVYALSDSVVLHFSAFYPQYKLSHLSPTKDDTVFKACDIAKETGLKYVYPGNTHPSSLDNTYCEYCGEVLIERDYYNVENKIKGDRCPHCGNNIF